MVILATFSPDQVGIKLSENETCYYMNDCSTVTVGMPDLKRLGIRHVKQKETTVFLNNW